MSHLRNILYKNSLGKTAEKEISSITSGEYFADCTLTTEPLYAQPLINGSEVTWKAASSVVTHASQTPVTKMKILWEGTTTTVVTCSSEDKAYQVTYLDGNIIMGAWTLVSNLTVGLHVWGYSGSLGGTNLLNTTGSVVYTAQDTTLLPTLYTVQKASPHNTKTVCFMGRMAVSSSV